MAVILNRPSLDKFESRIKPNGTLVLNTSMVDRRPQRTDLEILEMPMNEVAEEIGNPRGANMILLGLICRRPRWYKLIRPSSISKSFLRANHRKLLRGTGRRF